MNPPLSPEPKPGDRLPAADFAAVVRLTPLVALDLLVRDPDGRILLGRRVNEPARGSLFVPGGRITKNETHAAAFRRLCRAELGLDLTLDSARFVGVYDHLYPTNALEEPGFGTHYVVLAYEVRLNAPLATLPPDQHSDYVWATESEIQTRADVHPNTRAYFPPTA